MEIETRHRTFNPVYFSYGSTLDAICTDMETEGWELTRVVQHHQFESVAVFQRARKTEDSTKGGSYL